MENFKLTKINKSEVANDNIENADKKLERLEALLQKSFHESQSNGGIAGLEVDDLKTKYQEFLHDNPDTLAGVLARTEKNNDSFQQQLHALASEVADLLKVESMIVS